MNDEPDFVVIGLLRRAHGVGGEIYVEPVTDIPGRFDGMRRVLLRREGSVREIGIESVRGKGKSLILKFEGVDDRSSAKALTGAELGVRKDDVWPLPEGTYYVFDLVGCEVLGKNSGRIGVIRDVWKTGANDVLVVMSGSREVLIPAVGHVVKTVDLEGRTVLIEEMEGLLD